MDWSDEAVETKLVQPYEARKVYICPGCGGNIPKGFGHIVAVPKLAPDLRRPVSYTHLTLPTNIEE